MARRDWVKEQARFLAAHAETGIGPEEWCNREGLNFSTAKRYIKIAGRKTANSQKTTAKKNANSQKKIAAEKKSKKAEINYFPPSAITHKQGEENSFDPNQFGISEKQGVFAQHVAAGKNFTEAYRLAGYEGVGAIANSAASRMLRNVKVSRAIRWLRDKNQKRYTAELDELVHQLMSIANADPRELTQHRRVNCRYCWGENHLYQWRDIAEYDKAAAQHAKDGKPEPEYGGLGFVDNAFPNADCPKCNGEGTGQIHIADTDLLDGPARWLFAGVKQTKDGLQILMHDQDAARRTLLNLLTRTDALRKGAENIPSGFSDFYDDNIPTEPEPGIKKLLDDEIEE